MELKSPRYCPRGSQIPRKVQKVQQLGRGDPFRVVQAPRSPHQGGTARWRNRGGMRGRKRPRQGRAAGASPCLPARPLSGAISGGETPACPTIFIDLSAAKRQRNYDRRIVGIIRDRPGPFVPAAQGACVSRGDRDLPLPLAAGPNPCGPAASAIAGIAGLCIAIQGHKHCLRRWKLKRWANWQGTLISLLGSRRADRTADDTPADISPRCRCAPRASGNPPGTQRHTPSGRRRVDGRSGRS
jgi:hypothetical protein